MINKIKVWLRLNPDKAIYKHGLFWIAVAVPVIISSYLAYPLITGLDISLTEDGYTTFSRIFKFPLWILSGSILFGVIVARFHFSKQRSKSIEQTEKNLALTSANNNFKIYIDHKTYFHKKMENEEFVIEEFNYASGKYDKCCEMTIDVDKLYRFFFESNNMGHVEPKLIKGDITRIFSMENYNAYYCKKEGEKVFFEPFKLPIKIVGSGSFFKEMGHDFLRDKSIGSEMSQGMKFLLLCVILILANKVVDIFSIATDAEIDKDFIENIKNNKYALQLTGFEPENERTMLSVARTKFKRT
jgi:hypothetical protein